jgi:hypothetical protein
MQFYCIAIGTFLTYLAFAGYKLLEMNSPENIPEFVTELFSNSLVVVLGQWLLAFLLGNMFANRSIYNLYKPIIPDTMYAGYDYTMNAAKYRDDVQDFKSHSEVHIGKYYDAEIRRDKIKSKYGFAKSVLFMQVVASIIIYFLLQGF